MAYHLLVHSLRDVVSPRDGENQGFAECIQAAIQGNLPLATFQDVGARAQALPLSGSSLAAAVAENFKRDLNPFGLRLQAAGTVAELIELHTRFNQRSNLQIRTTLKKGPGGRLSCEKRHVPEGLQDIDTCRQVHVCAMEHLLQKIHPRSNAEIINSPGKAPERLLKVSDVAVYWGLGHALINDYLQILEEDPSQKLNTVALRLRWMPRKIQRHLAKIGVSAENLKRTVMINHATRLLASRCSLTEIAHASGYADQAHMCRAFVHSCGLPPSQLRGFR
ncbi:helix-turn-helix domain-containing protein [Curvibacter sp. RS43]|uniref:helix-turn-helix domain-containing protein n=1 Tax=Curvibacter microcysteis TaxID=3026419 RepID=UPI002362E39C|nr:helix-turn-helix domain-containing protein [Curvibacter sp. RS43]MDD0810031.1 helix-turn-helix domain-containing protein [Curvibacter sp. RS43]